MDTTTTLNRITRCKAAPTGVAVAPPPPYRKPYLTGISFIAFAVMFFLSSMTFRAIAQEHEPEWETLKKNSTVLYAVPGDIKKNDTTAAVLSKIRVCIGTVNGSANLNLLGTAMFQGTVNMKGVLTADSAQLTKATIGTAQIATLTSTTASFQNANINTLNAVNVQFTQAGIGLAQITNLTADSATIQKAVIHSLITDSIKTTQNTALVVDSVRATTITADTARISGLLKIGEHSLNLGAPFGNPVGFENNIFTTIDPLTPTYNPTLFIQSVSTSPYNTVLNYNNSGNVMIGKNTSPFSKLDVFGGITSSFLAPANSTALTSADGIVIANSSGTMYRKFNFSGNANYVLYGNGTWGPVTATSSNAWNLTGNAGTNPTTNFIGTTDAQDFVVKTGGSLASNERIRVKAGGNVGIGIASPFAKLHVKGDDAQGAGLLKIEGTTHAFANFDAASGYYAGILLSQAGALQWQVRNNVTNNFELISAGIGTVVTVLKSNSNVGIGTAIPGEKLEVTGSIKLSNSNSYIGPSSTDGIYFLSGNVGMGTITPTAKLHLKGDYGTSGVGLKIESITSEANVYLDAPAAKATAIVFAQAGSNLWQVRNNPTNNFELISAGVGTVVTVLKSNSNVGIGTATPGEKLEVNGNIKSPNTSYIGPSSINGVYFNAGNVGMGTTSLDAKLHIKGNYGASGAGLKIESTTSEANVYLDAPAAKATAIIFAQTVNNLTTNLWQVRNNAALNNNFEITRTGGTPVITITNTGNVGIGLATGVSPLHRLDLTNSDDVWKQTPGPWSGVSDIRIKKDTSSFTDGLEVLKQIHPVNYRFNGKTGISDTSSIHIGVIGQEIQKVAPYTIGTFVAPMDSTDTAGTELLSFNPGSLLYVVINAIKELAVKDSLKTLVDSTLQARIQKQDSVIQALQQQMTQCCTQGSYKKAGNTTAPNNDSLLADIAQLKKQMQQLEQSLEQCCLNYKPNNNPSPSENSLPDKTGKLEQNIPNPFTQNTTINYYLPAQVNTAFIVIYDLQGKEIKKFETLTKGVSSVTINGGELYAGMFIYALIVDGKASDSKTMVLTK